MKIKVLELFAGIGACSKALKNIGIDVEIVDAVEIDKYAIKSFNAIHGTNFEPQDITKWDKDIEVDLITHGSPCQDFSLAGLQAGGDKDSGTRSSLMYETIRIIEKLKPKYVLWENVKNLLSKKHRHNFDTYIQMLDILGYISYYQVLNAKDYGIPQNRERVYTISIRKDIANDFKFPEKEQLELKLKDLLENNVGVVLKSKDVRLKTLIDKTNFEEGKVLNMDLYNQTTNENISQCLTEPHHNSQRLYDGLRIRKLTPLECWRLMGFDDEDFYKAEKVNSNTQLYKQAGNSIVVKVLEKIFTNLFYGSQNSDKTLFDIEVK